MASSEESNREMDEEERLFNQAFGENTGISVDCREDIRFIKNNVEGTRMFRLGISDTRRFTDLAWRLLGQYISNDTELNELDLDGCRLTDEKMASLFSELVRSPLSELDIRNNSFGIDGLRCMVTFLENSPYLSVIDLSRNSKSRNNKINSECFEVLIKSLCGRPIRTLRLRTCNITDISALDTYSLPNLSSLYLSGNNIGREGCIVLSNMLQKDDTLLEALYLDSTGIEDEDVELIANSLKHNTTLKRLWLDENNITMRGYIAFLKILIDVSSIESTYTSNNMLTILKLGHHDKKSGINGKINSAVRLNKNSPNSHSAGKAKVIKYQLNSQIRKKLCRLQGIEYSEDNNVLAGVEPKLFPGILALIGEEHGQSEFYTSLMPIVPDLMSFIDRRAMIEDEKSRNAAHSSALNAEYEHKMAALAAEYERKMASLKTHFLSETSRLTAKVIDLNNRLALIELGDSKQAVGNN